MSLPRSRSPAIYDERLANWHYSQVVYQVVVDRFASSGNPRARAEHYSPPRRLEPWDRQPQRGAFDRESQVWEHELAFWGGDLAGITSRLGYIASLGANVLYLTPIFEAFTNHKYDTTNYLEIDPQFGSQADLEALCEKSHSLGMRVILDGVFNHTGRRNAWFQAALADPGSPFRQYYRFDSAVPAGYVSWRNVPGLPELNLENVVVRDWLFRKPDSVVSRYLAWADGWRLDVASDLGPAFLAELTDSVHDTRVEAFTVGEVFNYPADWLSCVDGVVNVFAGRVLVDLAKGHITAVKAGKILENLVEDCGIEALLRSWTVVSNHDTPRLACELPQLADREFVWALMAGIPGSPLIYYGEEIGLDGAEDPSTRGPMNWDLALSGSVAEQAILRDLISMRHAQPALSVGDFVPVVSDQLLAFTRMTARASQTILVVANATPHSVTEALCPRESWLLDGVPMRELRTGLRAKMASGRLVVSVGPRQVQFWVAEEEGVPGYQFLKRVP